MSQKSPAEHPVSLAFRELGLRPELLDALESIGYETPSSIQEQIIPHVLARRDVVGQAQTGTGKTAAFALPLLTHLKIEQRQPQVLVLVPTRELSIQVSEAFQRYAAKLPGFHVLPIYGGAGYGGQLRQLERGAHVIVATPGRLCDHLRRGTLKLDALTCLVLDEADEMLRMGFIDEVEWVLEQTPAGRQIALFSATMPEPIRRIAKRHLNDPVEITIKTKTTTAATIHQRYWIVSGLHKLDALTRILEGETFDAMLVFVRTKNAAVELAERLEARGFASAPLNGDIPQHQREKTVERLRSGELDILVATDVAARGLDVQRISHVINYDIPYDNESYVHRIGRTGRAGRQGEAILFVAPREKRLLQSIERATKQKIELMKLPTRESINNIRISRFKQRIADALAVEELGVYYEVVEQIRQEKNVSGLEIAAALARLVQGDAPLLYSTNAREADVLSTESTSREWKPEKSARLEKPTTGKATSGKKPPRKDQKSRLEEELQVEFESYRLDVGREHDVKPGQIMGAIANEAGLEGKYIGRIAIQDQHTFVDLPAGMPKEIFQTLRRARVAGRPMMIERIDRREVPAQNPVRKTKATKKTKPAKKNRKVSGT